MIINDDNQELILNELMSNTIYPLNYDKRTINVKISLPSKLLSLI